MSPAVINETVAVAKEYLDGELAKFNSFKELERASQEILRRLFDKFNFDKIKKEGVGEI